VANSSQSEAKFQLGWFQGYVKVFSDSAVAGVSATGGGRLVLRVRGLHEQRYN
jgi:hypothetical protein